MKNLYILFVSLMIIILASSFGFTAQEIEFGPEETVLAGAIKYSVIGKYIFNFDEYKGKVIVDPKTNQVSSVYMEIEAETINSSCEWCDKIVRSPQLLDVEKHPKIIFSGDKVTKDEEGYQISGVLDMHGVKKNVTFPFSSDITGDSPDGTKTVNAMGKWIILRKDYNIYWNRLLDKGGVLVGNHITLDWKIETQF